MPNHDIEGPKAECVLVVGAGASCDYNFPTGEKLLELIADEKDLLPVSDNAIRWHKEANRPSNAHHWGDHESVMREIEQNQLDSLCKQALQAQMTFRTMLAGSGKDSIDRFLSDNRKHGPAFLSLAKRSIAYHLLRCAIDACSQKLLLKDWHRRLFQRTCAIDGTVHPGLRVITFNYETSLDFSLACMNMNAHGLDRHQAEAHIDAIGIDHVYGSLSSEFLWTYYNNSLTETPRVTGWEKDLVDAVIQASDLESGIRIIGDEREDGDAVQRRWKWISEAEEVVFLGFGFDDTNCRLLGTHATNDEWTKTIADGKKRVLATAYRATTADKQKASRRSGIPTECFRDCKSLDLLKDSRVDSWEPGATHKSSEVRQAS